MVILGRFSDLFRLFLILDKFLRTHNFDFSLSEKPSLLFYFKVNQNKRFILTKRFKFNFRYEILSFLIWPAYGFHRMDAVWCLIVKTMTFIFVQFSNQGFFICGSFKLNFNKLRNYLMKHIAAGCCPRQALESCWDTVDAIHMFVQTKFSLSYTVVVLPTRFKWPTYIF